MNLFKRFVGHLRTVCKHRAMVRKLCFKCGLYWQGITHDLSKFSPCEFLRGVKYFTGKASPHVGERKAKGYSEAWIHHHNKNKHHAEYWQDIAANGRSCAINMPLRYFIEMICDRVTASMIYLGKNYTNASPFEYYEAHKDENKLSAYTRHELEKALLEIRAYGFDAFAARAWSYCSEDY